MNVALTPARAKEVRGLGLALARAAGGAHRRDIVLSAPPSEYAPRVWCRDRGYRTGRARVLAAQHFLAAGAARRAGRMSVSNGTARFLRRADGHILLELAVTEPTRAQPRSDPAPRHRQPRAQLLRRFIAAGSG